ncbi:TetR family transcriptional regulator [Virgisporangium aliadipatigenens]|uniref:TetR family transcriptional regulator n=1 Tax=Virgisporangium aliadipatigenens TaxID=741659 RepID=A0A8J3YKQ6_9ACTN|nr:TetR/AcrR family transcriptional regulator [Virgisporangium aliadipatigenens]GIJ45705.1 TetR family transcriptional regulator [Virgisporangium aliadipatigenens]
MSTKERLIEGALVTLRKEGIAGVSARTIAATAGVNQALVFYHFGSVDELLAEACVAATTARLAAYRERFAAVRSMRELLDVGRALHEEERELGNVTILAQLLAGSQTDPKLAPATARALNMWTAEIETVLTRLLADSPVAEVLDPPGLARAVAAGFVGIELYEGVDRAGAEAALAALERLAVLVEVADSLGPVARRALRSKLRRA